MGRGEVHRRNGCDFHGLSCGIMHQRRESLASEKSSSSVVSPGFFDLASRRLARSSCRDSNTMAPICGLRLFQRCLASGGCAHEHPIRNDLRRKIVRNARVGALDPSRWNLRLLQHPHYDSRVATRNECRPSVMRDGKAGCTETASGVIATVVIPAKSLTVS